MPSATSDDLLQASAEVARLAGEVALRHFQKQVAVEQKADGTPVTRADREAENKARQWIEAHFPNDGILGEEFGSVREKAPRRWILDPIDGTKTFVHGVPLWGTLVAVAEGDRILAGAARYPAVGEEVAAAPGQGCWWNGVRCQVSEIEVLERAAILATDERFESDQQKLDRWHKLARRAALSRSWGDCYGYLLVATGRAEVMVDAIVSAWDAAAFLPIIQEAGGVFTDWRGNATAFGGDAIATNAALSAEVRGILIPDKSKVE